MKEYNLSATTVKSGYLSVSRQRNEVYNKSTSQWSRGTWSEWTNTPTDGSGNKITHNNGETLTKLSETSTQITYRRTQTHYMHRIDLTFDVSGVDTTKVTRVKLRAKLNTKTQSTPLGYFVSSVSADAHYLPVTQLGQIDLGYPETPYEHVVTLSGISPTGWYCLWDDESGTFHDGQQLVFDATAFVLEIVTDESGTVTVGYRTGKVRLGAGTYTAFVAGVSGETPMACLIKTAADVFVTYYDSALREKITFTLTETCDVWVSVLYDYVHKLMIVEGSERTSAYIPYGTYTESTYIKRYLAEEVVGYIPTTGVNGHYEYDELNDEGTNTPGSEENPGVWVAPTKNEDRNLLQTKQINTFAGDGIHTDYYLIDNNVTVDKVEMYIRTRCRKENGEDVPDPSGSDPSVNYYWKYIWTEIPSNHATYAWTVTQAAENTAITDGVGYVTKITFADEPPVIEDAAVNIRVTYTPNDHATDYAVGKDRGYIEGCSIVARYGYFNHNRFWLSGNPNYRNMDFMSAIDDPTYFPASGWTKVGSDMTAIQGYLHYGTELAIIKEDNNQDATVYMRSAIRTEDNNILFPVQQGAQGVGAISKWCLKTLKDEPLFLAKEGVYAIQGTDASQERTIPNRSFFIDKKLQPEASSECVAEVFGDYYIVCNPTTGHCFVADARYMDLPPGSNNRQHIYEWYPWDNIPARVMLATDDYLFFGTLDGRLCVFNFDWDHPKRWTDGAVFNGATTWSKWNPYDDGYQICAHYVTKRDHLASLDYKKTMLNDGGVIVLRPHEQSSASITVTTDKGSWFVDHIQTDSDEPSVVIPIRKRVKNFDSIETRIENNEIREGLSILGLQYRYYLTTTRR